MNIQNSNFLCSGHAIMYPMLYARSVVAVSGVARMLKAHSSWSYLAT